jgi:hypothetical protein
MEVMSGSVEDDRVVEATLVALLHPKSGGIRSLEVQMVGDGT